MKKIFIALLIATFSLSASAQFEKGTKYFNASVSGFGLSYSKASGFCMNIEAGGGYFIADNWMLNGLIGWDHIDKANEFNLGLGGRYYLQDNGFFFGGGMKYGLNSGGVDSSEWGVDADDVVHNVYLTPEVGYCFSLNDHVSIEPSLFVDMCLNHFKDYTKFGLKLTFGYYF